MDTIDLSVGNKDCTIRIEPEELFCSYCEESLFQGKDGSRYNKMAMYLDDGDSVRLICTKCTIKAVDKLLGVAR